MSVIRLHGNEVSFQVDGEADRATTVPVPAASRATVANAGSMRGAALQARKTAGSASAPSPASGVYDTEQIRAELLAIRALLVS